MSSTSSTGSGDESKQNVAKAHSRIDALEKKLKGFEERLGKLEKKKKPATTTS